MTNTNPTDPTNNLITLQKIFKPELEKAQVLINGIEPPSLKDFALYFKAINDLKLKSQQSDPENSLGWANIIDDAVNKGFERLQTTPVNGGNVASIRRILESAENTAITETLTASIKDYRLSLLGTKSIYDTDEVYEDAASSDGSYSWVIYIAGLVLFNILSYIFDWGWILY